MLIKKALIQSCITQDRIAQKQLYEVLLPYLRAIACRYLKNGSYVKDALQESFVKIFQNIGKFENEKGSVKSWAAKIVVNTCLNYNQRVIGMTTEELVVAFHEDTTDPEVMKNLTDDQLLQILKQMPTGYFEIFNLFVIDGYNHQEIAKMLNISPSLSRKKLSRAKNWLRKSKNYKTSI